MRSLFLKRWISLGLVLFLSSLHADGVEISAEAKDRAVLYQAEAAKLFTEYHWRIVQNRPGEFTALHAAGTGTAVFNNMGFAPGPSGMGPIMAHVHVIFRPESSTSTKCFVHVTSYASFLKDKAGKPIIYGPSDADTPENTRYIRGKLLDAEKRMVRKHSEYGTR